VGGFGVCVSAAIAALWAFVATRAYVVRVFAAVFTDVHLEGLIRFRRACSPPDTFEFEVSVHVSTLIHLHRLRRRISVTVLFRQSMLSKGG